MSPLILCVVLVLSYVTKEKIKPSTNVITVFDAPKIEIGVES